MKTTSSFEKGIFNRVNPLVRFSVSRYVLSIGIFVAIVTFGIVSSLGLGVNLMPPINIPVVAVITTYSGANPETVDEQVTKVIEGAVSSVPGITDINSTSRLGTSIVVLSFDANTDKNAVLQQVAALVTAASRGLPTDVQAPSVRTFDINAMPILQFGISGGATPLTDVDAYVRNILGPTLERIPGVANVSFDGAPSREFQVQLNTAALRNYNITSTQVVGAISANAFNQPIGTITTNNNTLTFSTQSTPTTSEGIRQILVDTTRGLTVGNLATVRDLPQNGSFARVNGKPVILVSIQKTTDSNEVAVANSIEKLLKSTALPPNYSITFSNDTTTSIRNSVASTFRELWVTIIVVGIIVLLFLGKPNAAFSVILAIPISLAAAPILFKLAGFSFNLVSLLSMVVAIGIVVDDSIVVAENVERYRLMGYSLKKAVLKGASEVFSAVVAASLSLISVLIPISFLGGFIGRYLAEFSLGLAAAVLFSLLESLLFLTVRLAYTSDSSDLHWKDFKASFGRFGKAIKWGLTSWKKGPGILGGIALAILFLVLKMGPLTLLILFYPLALGLANYIMFIVLSFLESLTELLHGWTEKGVMWVRERYTRLLPGLLRYSGFVLIGTVVIMVGASVFVFPKLTFSFVPNADSGYLDLQVGFPAGTSQNEMNNIAGSLEGYLASKREVKTYQTLVNNNISTTIQLIEREKRTFDQNIAQQYRSEIRTLLAKTPNLRISVGVGGGPRGGGTGGTNSFQTSLVSPSFETLLRNNSAIIAEIQKDPFVADVSSSLDNTRIEQEFIVDQNKIYGTGISTKNIADLLQTYTSGRQAGNVNVGGLSYPITVQINPSELTGSQSLLDLPIYSAVLGTSLPVGQLGKFQLNQKPQSISRLNKQYSGTLSINLNTGAPTVLEMQKRIEATLAAKGLLKDGIAVASASQFSPAALASSLQQTGIIVFLLGFFLVYLVMAAQFNSWRYPVYLLLPVPLACVGALIFVTVIGGGLDIFGLLGILMLIGLSAKNAIIYLDFVVERIGKMPLKDALIDAAKLRFRPIVMTTLTVLVISFPLVFAAGQGAEYGQRLGIVMLGGILSSAILTFFVVPAAFYRFEKKKELNIHLHLDEIKQAAYEIENNIDSSVDDAFDDESDENSGPSDVSGNEAEQQSRPPDMPEPKQALARKRAQETKVEHPAQDTAVTKASEVHDTGDKPRSSEKATGVAKKPKPETGLRKPRSRKPSNEDGTDKTR